MKVTIIAGKNAVRIAPWLDNEKKMKKKKKLGGVPYRREIIRDEKEREEIE